MKSRLSQYSVLMTVWHKEKAQFLDVSLNSIFAQSYKTSDVVLVCDGPLTVELDKVISKYVSLYPKILNVVRLPSNVGTGMARNTGLKACTNKYVAIMDSDDYAMPNRCLIQMTQLASKSNIAILGGQMAEFIDAPSNVISVKKVPLGYGDICKYARKRDPFNNITVMLDKDVALAVGGYPQLSRCEDYLLYTTILNAGYLAENVDEVLCACRLTNDTFDRRGSWENLRGFVGVRWKIYRLKYSNILDFLIPCFGQVFYTILPLPLKKVMYQKFIRKK